MRGEATPTPAISPPGPTPSPRLNVRGQGLGTDKTHLVPVLHDVAGVGVGLYQLVLLVQSLLGQVLLQKCEQ